MSKPFSHTPPGVPEPRPGRVARRHVFYVPGYDPEARSRYRLLFVREATRYAKVFGQAKREIGRAEVAPLMAGAVPAPSAEPPAQQPSSQIWRIGPHPDTSGAETGYEVLLWDDIVARDFARPKPFSLLMACLAYSTGLLLIARYYRLHWKFANVVLYPLVMLLMLAAVMGAVGLGLHAVFGEGGALDVGLPAIAAAVLGVLAGAALLAAVKPLLDRIFFWQLVNDWVFKWQRGRGRRTDYERRLDAFADHVLARVRSLSGPAAPDEILIVGHSSGAITAVEIAARLIARDPGLGEAGGPSLGLVTLGSALPLVAVKPQARRLREEIASLVTCRRLVWVDYGAPQDWMNFPGFNPTVDLDLDLPPGAVAANPIIRSARFREIIAPETYLKVRSRPFRMHFQFLMSNDLPGEYDFFDMTLGPRRLLDRVLDADRAERMRDPEERGRDLAAAAHG